MTRARSIALAMIATFALGAPLAAQEPDAAPPDLQAQFRQRVGQIVKRQLGLTDEQLQQVGAVNKKYETQRFLLTQQEREIRITIRDEVLRGDSADQKRVARLLDEIMKVQSTRLQILQSEQKDLSAFLTPVQRAKYLAIQEQVRKRVQAMRQQGMGQGGQGQGQRRRQQQQPPPAAPPEE